MKLQRFFTAEPVEMRHTPLVIPSLELLDQLKKVLRMSRGDNVILFDNSGYQFLATIEAYNNESVSFNILERQADSVNKSRETFLFASIIKKDNFEWVVEKATELGVSHIVPIISARTEKKDINKDRLNKIIIEASEQSGRTRLPTLHEVISLEDSMNKFREIKSIAWEPTSEKFTSSELENISGSYIGPEGGWTKEELYLFEKHSITTRSLGHQILRAETAVISALSQLVFL
jgi:16S rRNA (uracil1498-N3)-methyltransferase